MQKREVFQKTEEARKKLQEVYNALPIQDGKMALDGIISRLEAWQRKNANG